MVTLAYRDADLLIEVTDTGRGPALGAAREADHAERGTGTGHGLAGMRERAASVGGAIEAGPRAAGGFRVAARLPVPEAGGPGEVAETETRAREVTAGGPARAGES